MRVVASVVASIVSLTSCGAVSLVGGPSTSRSDGGTGCSDDPEACDPPWDSGLLGDTGTQLVGLATVGLATAVVGYWWRSGRR